MKDLQSEFNNLKKYNMSTSKVLAGVIIGAAAGALLGILFAPGKGSETRKKFKEKGSDFADDMKSKASEYADIVSEKYEELKGKVMKDGKEIYSKAKDAANAAKSDVRESWNG
jgi:gas vesicle protein